MTADESVIRSLAAQIAEIEQQGAMTQPEGSERSTTPDAPVSDDSDSADGADADRAYRKLLELVAIREHSTHSVAKRLRRGGFSPAGIDDAVRRASAVGIVDDRRYADMLIRQRLASGRGLRFVFREIEELGIDPETLDAYEEYACGGEESEIERALAFLDRHPTRSTNLRAGAYRKLVTQGFPSAVAATAARRWAISREDMES